MKRYACPYLNSDVELSEERARHIAERHPDLLPAHAERIAQFLEEPDLVRRSGRLGSARLFSRFFPGGSSEKHVVVVIVSEVEPSPRHWVITAYQARKLSGGEIEWERS
ncbi:MAG TPA: hypothetical protein VM198_11410 [Longimicrobiales bacterium]|nr:hypothetical protein [Longimicrobiales bacterium]